MIEKLGLPREKAFYTSLVALVLPVALQNLVNNSLIFTDTFMLGFLGEKAIAAANLAGLPFFVVALMVFGFQSGSSVMISQYWGKRDTAAINKLIGTAMLSCEALVLPASFVMLIMPERVIGFMTTDAEVIALAAQYSRIVAFSFVANTLVTIYIGAQRSMENPKVGLYIHSVAMLLNTFLNYLLIFGKFGAPRLGVAGAALATLIARLVELVIAVVYSVRYAPNLRLNFKDMLLPRRGLVGDFFRFALPVIINESLWGFGTSLFTVIYARLGTATVAAYSIASNAEKVVSVFNFGVAAAAGVLVGKATGAGKYDEAYRNGKIVNILVFAQGIVMGALLFAISPLILLVMKDVSQETRGTAIMMLGVFSALICARGFNTTNIVGVLRGGGDSKFVMVLDAGALWFVGLPLAFLFGILLKLPPVFVMLGLVADEAVKLTVGVWRFRSKKWIRNLTR